MKKKKGETVTARAVEDVRLITFLLLTLSSISLSNGDIDKLNGQI
jgi:hypothetical protein